MSLRPTALRSAIGAILVLSTLSGMGVPATAASAAPAGKEPPPKGECPETWSEIGQGQSGATMTAVAAAVDGSWAAGIGAGPGAQPRPLLLHWDGTAWTTVSTPAVTDESALFGLDIAAGGTAWAAGYETRSRVYRPTLLRGTAEGVVRVSLPTGNRAGSLVAVGAIAGDIVAVGFATPSSGEVPLVVQRRAATWLELRPPAPGGRPAALLAVDGSGADDIWAGGWSMGTRREAPYLVRWQGERWTTVDLSGLATAGAIMALTAEPDGTAWAAGYRRIGTAMRPMVLRWDGTAWTSVDVPHTGSSFVIITGVAAIPGGVVVAGNAWDETHQRWIGFAGRLTGSDWVLDGAPSSLGSLEFRDVMPGTAPAVATIVGQTDTAGIALAWCVEPGPGVTRLVPRRRPRIRPGGALPRDRRGDHRPTRTAPTPTGPAGTGALRVRELADEVGLRRRTQTHGGAVADLDGNGWPDLFISRHSRPALLKLNSEGLFQTPEGAAFPEADRHACDAADVDADEDVDIFCGLGAHRGAGYKVNELWLRGEDGRYAPGGAASGAADVLGRARLATFFDLDHDAWPDLFVANKTPRTDGLPGPSVVLRRPGGGPYVRATTGGFDAAMGGDCLHAADLDRDGWEDILLCRKNLNGSGGYGVAWLRNEAGVLVDRTARLELPKRATMDAIPVDLDGVGWLEIAEITASRLIVHRGSPTGYVAIASAPLDAGRSVASGDADGDGTPDLFVVQGADGRNPRDRLFLVRDGGSTLERFPLPGTRDGGGDVALAIDHDRNGLTDFVVLNGTGSPGPIELFAFFRD